MLNDTIDEKIARKVERNLEEQLHFLSELISYKSLVGQEGEAQHFYAKACRDLGLAVELFEANQERIEVHPAYIDIGLGYAGRPNVVARLQGEKKAPSLILNGHIDVVSPEPFSSWSEDPWKGVIKDNRLYGRGSADMKVGLSANLFALKAILECGLKPKGEIIVESVIEEELGGSGGTLACLLNGVTADGMVISEPSQHYVWITHPGIKYFRVKVLGKPAHAAQSHQGVNAIVKMVPIIKSLEALDLMRANSLSYPRVEQQTGRSCNLSMGKMFSGDWVSTVAGWATLECRIGFVPGETGEQVMRQVEETIKDSVKGDEWFSDHPAQIEWFGWDTEPWVEPESSSFVKAFLKTGEKILGSRPDLTGASGGLDARFGQMFGTPSLSFGPRGRNYHGIDEYVEIDSLLSVTKTLALFVADWCGLTE